MERSIILFKAVLLLYDSQRGEKANMLYANSVGPDDHMHPYSLIWTSSLRRHKLQYLITKTRLFKYIENFTTKKWKFADKNSDSFHISA